MKQPPGAVGVVWYRSEEDYVRLKALAQDSDVLPDTYAEWLQDARRLSGTLTMQGLNVMKVFLDPETFPAWCKTHDYQMDAQARARYATDFAAARNSPQIHQR